MSVVTTQDVSERYDIFTCNYPRITKSRATELLIQHYGFNHVVLSRITTEKDDTFMVDVDVPQQQFIFKIENPGERYEDVLLRVNALLRLETYAAEIPVTRVKRRIDGGFITRCDTEAGTRWATLTTVTRGRILASIPPPYVKPLLLDIGRCLAQIENAISPLNVDQSSNRTLWDPRSAPMVARDMGEKLENNSARHLVEQAAARVEEVSRDLAKLPETLCHADFHPGNLSVAQNDPEHVGGIFDFGDMHPMPAVCDIGTSLLYFLDVHASVDPFTSCSTVLEGYRQVNPTFDTTLIALIPAVMKARCILTILLPLLVVTSDRSRVGHYQATTQVRLDQLRVLCEWDEDQIVRAIAPVSPAHSAVAENIKEA